jgi:hypothetical protein
VRGWTGEEIAIEEEKAKEMGMVLARRCEYELVRQRVPLIVLVLQSSRGTGLGMENVL